MSGIDGIGGGEGLNPADEASKLAEASEAESVDAEGLEAESIQPATAGAATSLKGLSPGEAARKVSGVHSYLISLSCVLTQSTWPSR